MIDQNSSRRPEVIHDETPSIITDHPFVAKGTWWSLCLHCNLAESAHKETTNPPFHYVSDDVEDMV
jgi:hypothetical protein